MNLKERANRALADRKLAIDAFGGISDMETLEALRERATDDAERKVLDLVILQRKREQRAKLEALLSAADFVDKAALPLAAAMPVFLTFLASEKFIVDPWRPKILIAAYLMGGLIWALCRFSSFLWTRAAKCGMAMLGKVD